MCGVQDEPAFPLASLLLRHLYDINFHGHLLPGHEPRPEVDYQHPHSRGDQDTGTGFFECLLVFEGLLCISITFT